MSLEADPRITRPAHLCKKKPKGAEPGTRYHRLTILEFVGRDKKGNTFVRVECDCGVVKLVDLSEIKHGKPKSCGCLGRETIAAAIAESLTPDRVVRRRMHRTWLGIKQRCLKPKHRSYPRYGGAGITICERWKHSFANFFDDMGLKPSPELTIERKDNKGPYSPENCIWSDRHTQNRNRKDNRHVLVDGVKMIESDAGVLLGYKCSKYVHSVIREREQKGITAFDLRGRRIVVLPKADP